jgi:hypothetical protein
MSSKRGRKRNDNLPPNRARDVQRAFRARRAAHLDVRIQSPSRYLFQTVRDLSYSSRIFVGPRAARLRAGGGKC